MMERPPILLVRRPLTTVTGTEQQLVADSKVRFYLGPDTMSGPTLSPVSLLCFTCDPSHRGKVPDFQHLRDNQRRAARQKKGERLHCSTLARLFLTVI